MDKDIMIGSLLAWNKQTIRIFLSLTLTIYVDDFNSEFYFIPKSFISEPDSWIKIL